MKEQDLTRRDFIATAAASAGSLAAAVSTALPADAIVSRRAGKLAILGGEPVRKGKSWPSWPYVDDKIVDSVVRTTKSGIWCRIQSSSGTVPTFEKEFAALMGTRFCVATGSGTQALHTCVEALGIGAGDEVITSPYTDPGTIASILSARALPVLADLDPASYQLDPDDVERRITENTRAIMPVHMMGQPCHMERIIARRTSPSTRGRSWARSRRWDASASSPRRRSPAARAEASSGTTRISWTGATRSTTTARRAGGGRR